MAALAESMAALATAPDGAGQEGEEARAQARAKAKAKKKRQKAKQKAKQTASYVNGAARRPSGPGKGLGLFSKYGLAAGGVAVRAVPALSCVFDAHATAVCGFCFAVAPPGGAGRRESVAASLRKVGGRVGVVLDAAVLDGVERVVVTGAAPDSPNGELVRVGDVVDVVGAAADLRGAGVLDRALGAIGAGGDVVEVTLLRPAVAGCATCLRHACCAGCRALGREDWHRRECDAFRRLPASATAGETSPLRMLLRYAAIAEFGDWARSCAEFEEGGVKEPLALVATLQANADAVGGAACAKLSALTRVPPDIVSRVIAQIRGNACGVERLGRRVGCALSVHMGYANHDCAPNAEATVDDAGFVTLTALRAIGADGEIHISYVDAKAPVDERRATLEDHYEFTCTCDRCVKEHRASLRARARDRGAAHYGNTSKLARDAYLHDGARGGAARGV